MGKGKQMREECMLGRFEKDGQARRRLAAAEKLGGFYLCLTLDWERLGSW